METNKRKEFGECLIYALKKITDSNCKILDEIYLEKLLTYIKSEFDNESEIHSHLTGLNEWLHGTLKIWKSNKPNVHIAVFFCQFIRLLCKNEKDFEYLQKSNIINELVDVLGHDLIKNSSLIVVLIQLFSSFSDHNLGYNWIINYKHWKMVVRIYFSNSSLYIEREGLLFIKKLIDKAKFNDSTIEEILQEILLPINKNEFRNTENEKILFSKMCLSIRLLEAILKEFMFIENNKIFLKLREIYDLESFLKSLLQNCEKESILEAAATLYIMLIVTKCEDKKKLVTDEDNSSVLEAFYFLLRKDHTEGIIKLAKFCQIIWMEIKKKLDCENKNGIQYIILQLVPALTYLKGSLETKLFDLFIQKLFASTSTSTQKFGSIWKVEIKGNKNSKRRDWALKGITSAMGNMETLNHDEAILIFQSMAYLAKVFVPKNSCDDEENLEKDFLTRVQDPSILSAVLNSLCLLIEKFKINWSESLESLCLLKISTALLKSLQLPSLIIVQTLLLVKLVILNFMSPNLALLINHTEDSSFDCLMPVLYERMHDPNWEIRDSCIEVIAVISELAESKFPAFQQLLVEKDFCSLVYNILEGDSESYVRASALRALSAMTKLECLNQCFIKLNFSSKIIELLQTESEGIVRREAALIARQIYVDLTEPRKPINSFYQVMGYSAICDLHWEVKVNSLLFWEAVIQRVISDQGMIDGAFPKVTFSKEHKKIVTLTSSEIKLRLDKVLKELSRVGCLYVLLSTLNDDCDLPVIEKSAQIVTELIDILKRYEVIKSDKDSSVSDRIKLKRKNQSSSNSKKRRPSYSNDDEDIINEEVQQDFDKQRVNSDEIIEEIVNEMDINLLVSVYRPKKDNEVVQKNILLKEIKPEVFLMQLQDFDSKIFLKEKQKWFMNVEVDLKSIINDININDGKNETNLMDCY